jgi:hypothetical protein
VAPQEKTLPCPMAPQENYYTYHLTLDIKTSKRWNFGINKIDMYSSRLKLFASFL